MKNRAGQWWADTQCIDARADVLGALIAAARRSPFARCEWCGAPTYGRACAAHRDLTELQRENQNPPHHLDVESAAGPRTGG